MVFTKKNGFARKMNTSGMFRRKNAQIINIFWSAVLIFFIIIESIVVLTITASRGEDKIEASKQSLSREIYGPVIPIYIIGDDSLSTVARTGADNDDISKAFRDKLSSLKGYKGFTAEIKTGNIPDDASYGMNSDGQYKEVFYFYRSGNSYVEMTLLVNVESDKE